MSALYRSGLALPIEATIASESLCSGHFETSVFQGLSGGKTCIAASMASASGVSNITGLVIGGSFCPLLTAGSAASDTLAKTNQPRAMQRLQANMGNSFQERPAISPGPLSRVL